jgi:hypothetical protein
VEWKVPREESVPHPPRGYVVLFVDFHEPASPSPRGRFIRAVLFEYRLHL